MSGVTEICALDATALARRIAERDVSPVEVIESYQSRLAAENPQLNAVVTPNTDAMSDAVLAEKAVMRGDELGSLHGVPFTVKDSFDTAGLRATRGSLLFENHIAEADATAVRRLRESGGILLGKTNVPEFALWAETDNSVFGPTVHPLDRARTPGGSSGGEAAAIADHLSPLGIGSDLSGSIRLPAHYCGIVGFKPTHGRVPVTGHWPQTLRRFTHVGPLARTVGDVRRALASMEGADGLDWFAEFTSLRAERRRPPEEVRVGWLGGDAFGPLDPEVGAALATSATALDDLVRSVESCSIPSIEDCDYDLLTADLYGAESAQYFEDVVSGRVEDLHPVLRHRLAQPLASLAGYLAADAQVERLRSGLLSYFTDFDLLLCPVSPVVAPVRDRPAIEVEGQTRRARSVLRATLPFDLAGVPAVSVPVATTRAGLPIGVQIVGRWSEDQLVLDVAELLCNARR